MSALAPQAPASTAAYWSDPLSEAEISEVIALIRADGRGGDKVRFWGIAVDEDIAKALLPGQGRPVRVVVMNPETHSAWEVAAWTSGTDRPAALSSWSGVDAKRPGVSSEEARLAAAAARQDPGMIEALAKRGINDPSLIWLDPESITGFEPAGLEDRRLAWGTVWHRESEDDNGYARPVAGLVPIIDMETLEVISIEDHGVIPMASESGAYHAGAWGDVRTDVKPLEITQPEGPGYTVHGQAVSWQNWSFRIGFTHREGLVLHDLKYNDQGTQRPVLRRASVNEMYVPYLDSDPTAYRKNFFDWGEYGAGPLTASLELGCDCLGEIHYFDAAVLDGHGNAKTIKNAICMHEEDDSILWKHVNTRTGVADVRRSRRLVISFFATVANYDYGFYWNLYQDGTVELDVKLTGILSVSGIADGKEPPFGRMMSPNVQAPNHQHYFGIRLDTAVDGELNRLVEVNAAAEEDEELNPYGNACKMVRTPLLTESAAARKVNSATARHWRVENTENTNRFGEPTAYRLSIHNTANLYARPGAVVARKAPFVEQHLWATQYNANERFIAGEYPNQAPLSEEGVHAWQQADRSLDGEKLVLWPVLGIHHHPRPEEWPIMNVHKISLKFEPDGFFERNPVLDLPPAKKSSCHVETPSQGSSCH